MKEVEEFFFFWKFEVNKTPFDINIKALGWFFLQQTEEENLNSKKEKLFLYDSWKFYKFSFSQLA